MMIYLTRGTHIILAKCKVASISPASTLPWCAIFLSSRFPQHLLKVCTLKNYFLSLYICMIDSKFFPVLYTAQSHGGVDVRGKLDSSDRREPKCVPRDLKKTLFKEQLSCETRLAGR